MGICNRRHFLLTICILQLITTVERQVFDFLGFMWAPILVNFFNTIFVILGFFGAFQYRPKYVVSYSGWNALWLGWNVFVICFYLDVGALDKNSDVLNLGTGSFSWWHVNGPGCKAVYDVTEPELFRPARPTNVTDCVLEYEVVEILHASAQCILAVVAVIGGVCLSKAFLDEDDSCEGNPKRRQKHPRPLYSVEYSQPEPIVSHDDGVSPKPMTPRRVKRRSVISRDGTRRSSRRSSVRQSRRKNPVNRIVDHQESLYANTGPSNLTNQNVNSLSQSTLNYDRISMSWDREPDAANATVGMAVPSVTGLWNQDASIGYASHGYRSNWDVAVAGGDGSGNGGVTASTRNLTDSWQPTDLSPMQWQGQSNPTFQQTSTQSLNGEDLDEIYNNRPASARSSYSNFHGVRATPQVPNRTDLIRQSQRQFATNVGGSCGGGGGGGAGGGAGGPPAYQDTVI